VRFSTPFVATVLALSCETSAFAFEKNMSKEEVALLQGKTFIRDLVVGDKAYVRTFNFCWDKTDLKINENVTIDPLKEVTWLDVSYTFLVERVAGGRINLLTLPDRVKDETEGSLAATMYAHNKNSWASEIGEALIERGECEDLLARNPSYIFTPVGTIDGYSDFKTWLFAIPKKDGEIKE